MTCPECLGTGQQWKTAINGRIYKCERCAGTGKVSK